VAPEVVRGEPADARSDLYSLGAMLYEMLCGRPPFTGESSMAIAYRHVQEEPVPIGQWNRTLPAGVEAIVMRCLAKDPDRRYSGATDLREALRGVLDSSTHAPATPRTVGLAPSPTTIPLAGRSRPPTVPPPPRRDTPTLRPDPGPDGTATPPARRRSSRRSRLMAAFLSVLVLAASLAILWSLSRTPADGGSRPRAPQAEEPLLAPTRIRTAGACDGFLSALVAVTWKPTTSSGAEGYEVFRGTTARGPFRSVAFVIGRSSTRYEDADVGSGNTYYYLVKSSGGGTSSAYSSPARAETPTLCLFP
jgi:hypothetical protein